MMRIDMDGLPIKEDRSLLYASTVEQIDPITKELSPVMHACGHDQKTGHNYKSRKHPVESFY